MRRGLAVVLLLVGLAGCGGYPQPFAGNPGATAARLALPPPPRLVVETPQAALLGDADAVTFAQDLAAALADRTVPAVAAAPNGADWRLVTRAEMQAGQVIPTYTVQNPKGIDQGSTAGPAISGQTWSLAEPTALTLVATRDAPAIAALLDRISASLQQSDPNSLVNRPPRVAVLGVTGAPGDGNRALAKQITQQLTDLGIVVQNTGAGADYSVKGSVLVAASGTAGQSRVEIQWTVLDPYGKEAGHLLQMNDIPQGSLDGYWGDVAMVVAQEAAGGVKEVMSNRLASRQLDTRPKKP